VALSSDPALDPVVGTVHGLSFQLAPALRASEALLQRLGADRHTRLCSVPPAAGTRSHRHTAGRAREYVTAAAVPPLTVVDVIVDPQAPLYGPVPRRCTT
jgi:hypothetical protein